jgi:hypothetical protein
MAAIRIEKLALEVPGMSESGAQSLALAVAGQLGTVARLGAVDVPAMRVELIASPDTASSRLAADIVAELTRQLQRVP